MFAFSRKKKQFRKEFFRESQSSQKSQSLHVEGKQMDYAAEENRGKKMRIASSITALKKRVHPLFSLRNWYFIRLK